MGVAIGALVPHPHKILRVGGLRPPLHLLILLYGCVSVYIIIIIIMIIIIIIIRKWWTSFENLKRPVSAFSHLVER